MFYADQPEVEDRAATAGARAADPESAPVMKPGPDNLWWVTETDADDNIVSQNRIAMKPGATAGDAIAAMQEASAPPSEVEIAAQAVKDRTAAIKAACSHRILAVLDLYTTSNITGAFVAGELDEAQMVTFRAGRTWVAAMQDASRAMILDPLMPDHNRDDAWLGVPEGVVELAARF